MEIGDLLRRQREGRGVSLDEVSQRTGIAVPNLSRLESGRTDPRWSTVARVAAALGLTLELVEAPTVVSLPEMVAAARRGRERVLAAGLGISDPADRLRRREAQGEDTRLERALLGEGGHS